MSKIVYLFDEVTGEYSGTYLAQKSPLEEGVFITPTASTDVEPPSFDEAKICKFTNGEWVVTDKPAPPAPQELTLLERRALKQSEIDALEASQYMTRGEREGWLAMIEAQAAAQSVSLDTLYGVNPFYKKLKDVDDQVTALRAELKAIV